MASAAETVAMRRALELAASPGVPLGPNPRVGAVLLDPDGEWLAEGWHRGAGTPHAEVAVLQNAGASAEGATLVVTLEPCNHTGRTGPCSAALIAAGVRRVVYAQRDATVPASGGAQALRAAGVATEAGVLAREAKALNPVWSFSSEHARPFVTWKFAATVDGRSAAADGGSRWITGPEARFDVHRLRGECDAVLVGTGTVQTDNPRLTVRGADGVPRPHSRQPIRAVMGLTPVTGDLHVLDASAPFVHLKTRDVKEALARLSASGCHHVWLEGGPTLAAAFLQADMVDAVVAYLSPSLLGAGQSAVGDLGISTMSGVLRFGLSDVTRLGNDVRLTMGSER